MILVAVGAAPVVEQAAPALDPQWQLSLAVATGRPAVLPGLATGVTAEADWRLSTPLFLFARAGWTTASAANVEWVIDHQQFTAVAGVGLSTALGVGRLFAQAGAGASGLYETLSRHQRQRIEAAGVPGGVETSFTVGAMAAAEGGVAISLLHGVSALFAGGPAATQTDVNGKRTWRVGGAARLGVAYDF